MISGLKNEVPLLYDMTRNISIDTNHKINIYCSIIWSADIYDHWKDQPTVTTINTTAYPIKNVEFPAITICSQGMAKDLINSK